MAGHKSLSGVGLRVAAVSLAAATMGLPIATIGRNTAAALGIVLATSPWSRTPSAACAQLAANMVAYSALALVALAVASFRRRDIA